MQQKTGVKREFAMTVPLDLLVCPKCNAALDITVIEGNQYLGCAVCKLAYPVRDGIPVMLQDEAVKL